MASLRKKPTDVVDTAVPEAPAMANAEPVSPPPALAAPELDDAGKALQRQIDALRQAETMQQQAQIAKLAAEERRQHWLAATPGARKNIGALGAFHHAALTAGLADTSPEYFSFMESQLAELQQPTEAANNLAREMHERAAQSRTPEPPPRPSRVAYSAPVSHEIPTANGYRESNRKVTLTAQEQEMARVSGVTLEEYAKQKLRLRTMRETGEYSEDRR
jgi:hypothetical protein